MVVLTPQMVLMYCNSRKNKIYNNYLTRSIVMILLELDLDEEYELIIGTKEPERWNGRKNRLPLSKNLKKRGIRQVR